MSRRLLHSLFDLLPTRGEVARSAGGESHSPIRGCARRPAGVGRTPGLGGGTWCQIFSATRSRAQPARGLAVTSASEGRTGRRVTIRRVARWPQVQTGCWGGQMRSLDSTLKNDLPSGLSREGEGVVPI